MVGVDQAHGSQIVVEHLQRTGVRSVTHLAGPTDWFDAQVRRSGFTAALERYGLDGEVVGPGEWTPRAGYELTTALIASGLPDAIFAANDMIAIGALHALHEHGLRVPEDVSVVGFDNTLGAEFLIPSLTTVAQPFAEVGREALRHLVSLVDGELPLGPGPAHAAAAPRGAPLHPSRTHALTALTARRRGARPPSGRGAGSANVNVDIGGGGMIQWGHDAR